MSLTPRVTSSVRIERLGNKLCPYSVLAVLSSYPPYPTLHCDVCRVQTGTQARPALHRLIRQPNYVELIDIDVIEILQESIESSIIAVKHESVVNYCSQHVQLSILIIAAVMPVNKI